MKTFLRDQVNKQVLLLLDNQTAVAYVNNLGATVSAQATRLVRAMNVVPRERNSSDGTTSPGKENVRADRVESDHSNWMLNR